MNQAGMGWAAWRCLVGLLMVVGCGSTDGSAKGTPGPNMGPATAECGSVSQPHEFEITNLTPALGSSVPNVNIVQTFTIANKLIQVPANGFARPAAHTAGASIPAITTWTFGPSGADTVYTSAPLSWTTAPGHVQIDPAGLIVTTDGCVFALPNPLFSYDITAP